MTERVPHKSRIVTDYEYPPIPDRSHDWRATFEWFCGDDYQPTGWGETEAEAVLDLMNEAADFEDYGACLEEVINWAIEGWHLRAELAEAKAEIERKNAVLQVVASWNLPPSGVNYPNADGTESDRPAPYDSFFANGFEGGREYIRNLARQALKGQTND